MFKFGGALERSRLQGTTTPSGDTLTINWPLGDSIIVANHIENINPSRSAYFTAIGGQGGNTGGFKASYNSGPGGGGGGGTF